MGAKFGLFLLDQSYMEPYKAKEGLAWAYGSKKGLGRANRDWGEEYYPLNGGSFEIVQKYSKTR